MLDILFFNASKKTSIRHESITKNKTFGFFVMIIILGIGFQPMQYKVSVIGMGFVGLSLSSFLATKNIHVIGIDSDKEKISKISKGVTPFFEPKLDDLLKIALKKSFQLTNQINTAVIESDFIFICVGTPMKKDGSINLKFIKSSINELGKKLIKSKTKPIIIIKSNCCSKYFGAFYTSIVKIKWVERIQTF